MSNYQTDTDEQLLKKLAENDEPAFAEIYRRYSGVLFTTAYNFLKRRDGAEDAVQEIFLSLWKRRNLLDIRELEGYLKQSVRYYSLRAYQQGKKNPDFYSRLSEITEELAAEDSSVYRDLQELLEKVLSHLPADQQTIFRLNRVQGFTFPEIAAQLNISVKTVEKKMARSLKYIRENMSEGAIALLLICEFTR
jgi:RNA polymerase sigma-70 factor (ECF subfamily)